MAINTIKATIQMRRGLEQDFDADQMTAGEWAVSTDNQYVRMCFAPGIVVRMATYEAFEQDMKEVQLILATCRDIQTAVDALAKLAEQHKDSAAVSALEADNYQKLSKSYAVGTGGEVRENDDTDNSKYYYEQSKRLAQGFNGIMPMGTITFAELSDPLNQVPKYMFNISDSFVSDDRFKDGGGIYYGAGNNVVFTADGMWDALSASAVTGVKGDAETEYRQGNVSISPEDIGIVEATTEKAGLVRPDGKTIMVETDGTIVGAASGFTGTTAEVEEAINNGEIEEGMIVNITDDYEPPEDITPESIGAVAKTGDTMTGLLQLEKGSICYTFTPEESVGLYCFGCICITSAYVSNPIAIEISMRGKNHTSTITFAPNDAADLNTNVRIFTYEGDDIDIYTWRVTGDGVMYFPLCLRLTKWQTSCVLRINGSVYGYEFERRSKIIAESELPDYAIKAIRKNRSDIYRKIEGSINSPYSYLYAHRTGGLIILQGSIWHSYEAIGHVYIINGILEIESLLYPDEILSSITSTLQGISINANGTALANPNIVTSAERGSGTSDFVFKTMSDTAAPYHHQFAVLFSAIKTQ